MKFRRHSIVTVDKRPGRPIGYARVSTLEQNLDMQIEAFNRAGIASPSTLRRCRQPAAPSGVRMGA